MRYRPIHPRWAQLPSRVAASASGSGSPSDRRLPQRDARVIHNALPGAIQHLLAMGRPGDSSRSRQGIDETVCGWRMAVVNDRTEDRTLLNFHWQATCADIMRRAVALMADREIAICDIIHDEVMIEDALRRLPPRSRRRRTVGGRPASTCSDSNSMRTRVCPRTPTGIKTQMASPCGNSSWIFSKKQNRRLSRQTLSNEPGNATTSVEAASRLVIPSPAMNVARERLEELGRRCGRRPTGEIVSDDAERQADDYEAWGRWPANCRRCCPAMGLTVRQIAVWLGISEAAVHS